MVVSKMHQQLQHILHINICVINNIIKHYVSTIWGETDGCAKRYVCETAFYLFSIIVASFSMLIDCAVEAPGNGEDFVKGVNEVDKKYLKMVYVCCS